MEACSDMRFLVYLNYVQTLIIVSIEPQSRIVTLPKAYDRRGKAIRWYSLGLSRISCKLNHPKSSHPPNWGTFSEQTHFGGEKEYPLGDEAFHMLADFICEIQAFPISQKACGWEESHPIQLLARFFFGIGANATGLVIIQPVREEGELQNA